MAVTNTTLSSACGAGATTITVASASGFTAGQFILVEQELMQQTAAASGTVVPVRRGLDGTVQGAHAASAFACTGLTSDFPGPAPGQTVTYGPSKPDGMQENWGYYTYSAAGAISPVSGVHTINGSGALAMTLAGPTGTQEGAQLVIESKNLHANTVVATPAFLGGAGATATFAATGGNLILKACGGKWTVLGSAGATLA